MKQFLLHKIVFLGYLIRSLLKSYQSDYQRGLSMNYLFRVIITLIISGGISFLPAQWTVSVSGQQDNRGYQLQTTSSGPQTGYGLAVACNIYDPLPTISITGRIEIQSLTNSFRDSDWFMDDLLLAYEYKQQVTRVGFLSCIQFNSTTNMTSHPYFGAGAGVEHFRQELVELYRNLWADFLKIPRDRAETSSFLVVLLGLRITLNLIEPYLEWRRYNTYHSDSSLLMDCNLIPNGFNAVHFGVHFKLFSQPAPQ